MFQNLVDSPFKFYHFGGNAASDSIWRNVFGYNCSSSNNCSSAYSNSCKKCNIASNPNVILYYYILVVTFRFVLFVYISYEFTDNTGMISGMHRKPFRNCAVTFADKLGISRRNPRVACQIAVFIQKDI